MFEHMKNYELLLEKVSNWLKPEGKVRNFPWIAAAAQLYLQVPCSLCLYGDSAQYSACVYQHKINILRWGIVIMSFHMPTDRLHTLIKCTYATLTPISFIMTYKDYYLTGPPCVPYPYLLNCLLVSFLVACGCGGVNGS